jgi:hypothetical protein
MTSPQKILHKHITKAEKRIDQIFKMIEKNPKNFEMDNILINYTKHLIDLLEQVDMYRDFI